MKELGTIAQEAIATEKAWKGGKKGDMAWLFHHEILCEPITESPSQRIRFIQTNKVVKERAIRLRCFRRIKGALPKEIVETSEACKKAWETYDEACKKAWGDYSNKKAWEDYSKAQETYIKRWEVYEEAVKKHTPYLTKLMREEIPGCPWNGKTLFPK